jgi:hypothetical protein
MLLRSTLPLYEVQGPFFVCRLGIVLVTENWSVCRAQPAAEYGVLPLITPSFRLDDILVQTQEAFYFFKECESIL